MTAVRLGDPDPADSRGFNERHGRLGLGKVFRGSVGDERAQVGEVLWPMLVVAGEELHCSQLADPGDRHCEARQDLQRFRVARDLRFDP